MKLLYSRDKCWKSIPRIIKAKLVSANAEWLTRRTSNDNVSIGKDRFGSQKLFGAFSMKIGVIGSAAIRIGFKSSSNKTRSLKAKRKPPTTGKKIQNPFRSTDFRAQHEIDQIGVRVGCEIQLCHKAFPCSIVTRHRSPKPCQLLHHPPTPQNPHHHSPNPPQKLCRLTHPNSLQLRHPQTPQLQQSRYFTNQSQ